MSDNRISDGPVEIVLGYDAAAAVVLEQAAEIRRTHAQSVEHLPLLEAASRVLAESICADRDFPPFARSTRDGFAAKSSNLNASIGNGPPLRVVGQLRAGMTSTATLRPGEALEIMTGAPVPEGADCVVMLEHVVVENGGVEHTPSDPTSRQHDPANQPLLRMAEGRSIAAGANIVPQGSEAKLGSLLVGQGTPMLARQIAIAAACGKASIAVFVKPRVAIVATGDELVELHEHPCLAQIRNSNTSSLAAQVLLAGGQPVLLPIARDRTGDLSARIAEAASCDLLLLSGGVSAGKYDLVEEVLRQQFAAEFFFNGVRIQPGKPVVFGRMHSAAFKNSAAHTQAPLYFFGLPGNPVSTLVTFELFVRPIIESLVHAHPSTPRFALAILEQDVVSSSELTRFLPAFLDQQKYQPSIRPIPWQGSGDMASAARANACIMVPPDTAGLSAGTTVTALLL